MRCKFHITKIDGEKITKKMGLSCINQSLLLSSLLISLSSLSLPLPSHAADTIGPGGSIKDGETLISPGLIFELGFFSPGRSKNRYVGIWYYNFSNNTVLWVANRENPVPDTSGTLAIGNNGNLEILRGTKSIIWTSNISVSSNQSSLQLTDSGNLVLNNSGTVAWQSFEHPTDTYLPGMKVGLNLRTNVNQLFTSWRSDDDPGVGNFSLGIDPKRSTQIFLWEGTKPRWRSGRYNGQVFIGVPVPVVQYGYRFKLSNFQQEQLMYLYSALNSSNRYVLTWDGIEKHLLWKDDSKNWSLFWAQPITECEFYNKCGNYGSCTDESTPICSCLTGFMPVSDEEWSDGNWSSGCFRRTKLQCEMNSSDGEADGFLKMEGVKLPDLSDWNLDVFNETDCAATCLKNCSCRAYSYQTGIGCLIWGVDLVDIHMFSTGGSDMYLRLAGSELDEKMKLAAIVIVIIVVASVFLLGCIYLMWKRRRRIKVFLKNRKGQGVASMAPSTRREEGTSLLFGKTEVRYEGNDGEGQGLPLLSFDSILAYTDNFSNTNLLGEGGFGPVYMGVLPGGEEIAVKRLSSSSGQGSEEFKNEVILIAKLQHRNLVRLLSCCIHGEEKILIYEYMRNGSLDIFLFDPRKKGLLDWSSRYKIIEGIARGLLYLHRDSRLRIIHRDLKASNILLDDEMNPKISDFGMARIFGKDDNETNTQRIVGTYGYMSPEYAMQGRFSVKSDVYSFGVLLLEIVSGKKISTYHHPELYLHLLAYAWKVWNEDNVMELVDPSVRDSCSRGEVSRCINMGLLCVQDRANDRPTMPSVMIMLESGTTAYPLPRQPTFTAERSSSETDLSTDRRVKSGTASITMLTGR